MGVQARTRRNHCVRRYHATRAAACTRITAASRKYGPRKQFLQRKDAAVKIQFHVRRFGRVFLHGGRTKSAMQLELLQLRAKVAEREAEFRLQTSRLEQYGGQLKLKTSQLDKAQKECKEKSSKKGTLIARILMPGEEIAKAIDTTSINSYIESHGVEWRVMAYPNDRGRKQLGLYLSLKLTTPASKVTKVKAKYEMSVIGQNKVVWHNEYEYEFKNDGKGTGFGSSGVCAQDKLHDFLCDGEMLVIAVNFLSVQAS